jgi:hypothetical protein
MAPEFDTLLEKTNNLLLLLGESRDTTVTGKGSESI